MDIGCLRAYASMQLLPASQLGTSGAALGPFWSNRVKTCYLSAYALAFSATVLQDEDSENQRQLLLKRRAGEIVRDLKGTCIFLIGMMGSEKSMVGKALADALGYQFFDSDKLIQDATDGNNGNQIFDDDEEEGFRDAETEILKQLSSMCRLVVATGGGIVLRPSNWSYLRHGLTVWLDVPLETLAERVIAAGTSNTQPLQASSSTLSEALKKLSDVYKIRGPLYSDADVVLSFQRLALHSGCTNVGSLTSAMVAVEVLEEISHLIRQKKRKGAMFAPR